MKPVKYDRAGNDIKKLVNENMNRITMADVLHTYTDIHDKLDMEAFLLAMPGRQRRVSILYMAGYSQTAIGGLFQVTQQAVSWWLKDMERYESFYLLKGVA